MKANTFRQACCERFGWPPQEFEQKLLWHCFPRRSLTVGKFFWRTNRQYFVPDLELIRAVAECRSCSEVRAELADFRYHQPSRGFWRKRMRVRLSGQRLVDTAAKILG